MSKKTVTLTVAKLVEILKSVPNQSLPVFVYDCETAVPYYIQPNDVDLSLSDRVDINLSRGVE